MIKILKDGDEDFFDRIDELLVRRETRLETATTAVTEIIAAIRERRDEALLEYTKKFDGIGESMDDLLVPPEKMFEASNNLDPDVKQAMFHAAVRIESFHRRQARNSLMVADEPGVVLGQLLRPLRRVCIYVPGGKAAYPSSVLMNAIPAMVAGVDELVMVSPAPGGEVNPLVLAAANLAGVKEFWNIGGAQAVAALALGIEAIPRVDKIVGPGNIYVAEAKRQLYGTVDIDMVAGPSEIVIISDGTSDPAWLAADMLSQLEHDEEAMAVMVTSSEVEAEAVAAELEKQVAGLNRKEIAESSLKNNSAIVVINFIEQAVDLVNYIAPEHLEIVVADPWSVVGGIRNAGAIFLGPYTPEPIGDYIAGPNHVLPTSGTARFFSPLSVDDFMKKTNLVQLDAAAFSRMAPDARKLAELEGLDAHAAALKIRMPEPEKT